MRTRTIFVFILAVFTALGLAGPAQSAVLRTNAGQSEAMVTGVVGDWVRVNSILMKSDGSIRVSVTTKKTIPQQLSASLSWRYPAATRNNGDYSRRAISRSVGTRYYFLTGVPRRIMSTRIMLHFGGSRYFEEKTYYRHSGPAYTLTSRNSISATEAAAGAVAMHLPGAVMTFAPQGRAIKFAGVTLLGWTVWSDVRTAVSGESSSCRKMRAGDYVVTNVRYSPDGSYTKVSSRTRMFSSYTAYANGRTPVCDTGYYTQARYR